MHADGAGTKSSLAYLYWQETDDLSVWRGIAQDAIVMNTDDLLCCGATGTLMLSSTIGRNKKLIPGEVLSEIIAGTEDFIRKMKKYQANIISTGGETADVGDLVRTLIADTTVITRMKRSAVIIPKIQPGDVIIGLASFGQTIYENEYNSGIGSNGLTSARHDLLDRSYASMYKESYDASIPEELAYCGMHRLREDITVNWRENTYTMEFGKLLLSPTRTYYPIMQEILRGYKSHIHAIIHCTGGGQTKVLNFINGLHIIKDNLFEIPPVFKFIMDDSDTTPAEMYRVFNMGHRMELYVPPDAVQHILNITAKYCIDAQVIGRVQSYKGKKLTIDSPEGTYEYEK
jgi:phosphoribosylformylglycinamidine cyclo-ligase